MTSQKKTDDDSPKKSVRLLNLGSGETYLDGWWNVDINPVPMQFNQYTQADDRLDMLSFPWPYRSSYARRVMASHILEHFYKEEAVKVLEECHRVLKKGGVLHLAVPDLDKFVIAHLTGDFTPLEGYSWTDLNYMMGGDERETRAEMKHRYMYTWEHLAYVLLHLGFAPTQRYEPLEEDNPRFAPISLYIDAVKA